MPNGVSVAESIDGVEVHVITLGVGQRRTITLPELSGSGYQWQRAEVTRSGIASLVEHSRQRLDGSGQADPAIGSHTAVTMELRGERAGNFIVRHLRPFDTLERVHSILRVTVLPRLGGMRAHDFHSSMVFRMGRSDLTCIDPGLRHVVARDGSGRKVLLDVREMEACLPIPAKSVPQGMRISENRILETGSLWRHRMGGLHVVQAFCDMESDGRTAVLYRSMADGTCQTKREALFLDDEDGEQNFLRLA